MDVPNHIMARFRRMMNLEAPEAGSTPAIPEFVGHYRIGRVLGTGASAVVCEAEDLALKRRVALKILRPEGGSTTFLARFHREASLAANLKHPNLITIHEVAMVRSPDGAPLHYIVMDCVPRTLRDWSEETGKPDPRTAARLVGTVARAIHHAHERGIIHRDLKPANILIDEGGRPIVTDFGLAKDISDDAGMTKSGVAVGTPLYMSPEQIRGDSGRVGAATDVYSLGAILYELLTGRPPFTAENVAEIYTKVLRDPPSDARTLDRAIPAELSAICRKALEKDPTGRYASAEALAQDLDRFLAGQSVLAMKTHLISQIGRAVRRHPGRLATILFLVVAAAAMTGLWKRNSDRARESRALLDRTADLLNTTYLRMKSSSAEFEQVKERARTLIDQCLAADPDSIQAHVLKIQFLMHGTKFKDAENAVREARKIDPSHPRVMYFDAVTRLLNRIDAQAALRNEQVAIGGLPDPGPTTPADVELIRENQRSREILERSGAILPHESAFIGGLLMMVDGRRADAIPLLGTYIASMPFDALALQARAEARRLSGDAPGAIDDVSRAIDLFPTPPLYRARGEMRLLTGDFTEALADLARSRQEEDPTWQVQRGMALLLLNRLSEATEAFDLAVALDPGNGYWRVKRSIARRRAGALDKALEDCNEALKANVHIPTVLEERAKIHLERHEDDLAMADLGRIVAESRGRTKANAITQIARMKLDPAGSPESLQAIITLCDQAQVEEAGTASAYSLRACARYNLIRAQVTPPADELRRIVEDVDRYLKLAPKGQDAEMVRHFRAWAIARSSREN